MKLGQQSSYDGQVFINEAVKKEVEKQIDIMFNALIRDKEWNWERGEFDEYTYCQHKEKQHCGIKGKAKFQLHINEWYCWGDTLIECKLTVINWFLHGRPFYPFIK